MKLDDWTTYVFASMVIGAGLGGLYYWEHYDIYNASQLADKQYNEPSLSQGTWRVGALPATGGTIELHNFVVYRVKGMDEPQVARVLAFAGQKVEVKGEEIKVDGTAFVTPGRRAQFSRFDVPELVVPRGCVFVVCDQRSKGGSVEVDSRRYGPIPIDAITHTFKSKGTQKGGG
jgi:type IV secretory pathway protease TraF